MQVETAYDTEGLKDNQVSQQEEAKSVVDLVKPQIQARIATDYGKMGVTLQSGKLTLEIQFKKELLEEKAEGECRKAECVELYTNQMLTLVISQDNLTPKTKQTFPELSKMAQFVIQHANEPNRVSLDEEKMTLTPLGQFQQVKIFYEGYRLMSRSEVEKEAKKYIEELKGLSQSQLDMLETDLILRTEPDISELLEDMLLAEDEDTTSSEVSDHEQSREAKQFSEVDYSQNAISMASDIGYEFQPPQAVPYVKQNAIPIYERFRGLDLNMNRRDMMKLAEQMVCMGYNKDEIMRFFSGGAAEMEAENSNLPDYRNSASLRYKQIHMFVAKKQNERHNKLLKSKGMAPLPPLPQFQSSAMVDSTQNRDKKIHELIVTFLKEKKIKRLDLLQAEFRKYGMEVSVVELKQKIEGLKQKARQKNEQAQKMVELNAEVK